MWGGPPDDPGAVEIIDEVKEDDAVASGSGASGSNGGIEICADLMRRELDSEVFAQQPGADIC